MAYVRGHYRNGRYVRPHHRRTRPTTASAPRRVPAPRRVAATVSRPQYVSADPTTHVRGHYRNGRYVRPHSRRLSTPVVAAAAGGGTGLLLLLLVLASLGGSGTAPKTTPEQHPTPGTSHTAVTSSEKR
ncbi:hypothetical protein ACFTZI_00005 [Streptomyces decoyicus]|uniref:hypothetical protein n=1 Tax=Streptomyces decoyicus TaxID=249567 RepID=UPI003629B994